MIKHFDLLEFNEGAYSEMMYKEITVSVCCYNGSIKLNPKPVLPIRQMLHYGYGILNQFWNEIGSIINSHS